MDKSETPSPVRASAVSNRKQSNGKQESKNWQVY